MSDAPILLAELEQDPYPLFARLRTDMPLAWIAELRMWYVTRYADVVAVLRDTNTFVVGTDESLLSQTFGDHMLTCEGTEHDRFRNAFRGVFAPRAVADAMTQRVARIANELVDEFADAGSTEFRRAYAARLPVLTMLDFFGLDRSDEPDLRRWYDGFEAALSNFGRDATVTARAAQSLAAFHNRIQRRLDAARVEPSFDALSGAVTDESDDRLSDAEICRNAGIIFFGGISTVEALILNCLYAIDCHPGLRGMGPLDNDAVIEETMRWAAPVQSATRHVARPTRLHGMMLNVGDTVNCMLGAANRDPAVFADPDTFDPSRRDLRRHLGFALGNHFCLGSHLARIEARTTLEVLERRLPGWHIAEPTAPEGIEFRQPRRMVLRWSIAP